MAKEIPWVGTTGMTLYAQVFNTVGQFWNTASVAFENYATANIADYDVALVEQGTASGMYFGTFPAAITSGSYTCVIRNQTGVGPAEGDFALGTTDVQWSGTAVIPLHNLPVRLADAVTHGGTTAMLRLGSSTATPAFYVTNSGGDAVQFEATGGNGIGFDIIGEGTGIGMSVAGGANNGHGFFAVSYGGTGIMGVSAGGVGIQAGVVFSGRGFVADSVEVTGTTTLTGAVSLGSTLSIAGTVTFNAFTVTNSLIVSGVTTLTGAVTATNAGNDIKGVSLAAAGLDLIVIEVGLNARQALAIIASTTAGEMSGGGTGTEVFRNAVADSANRLTATVDSNGNRTAITYNLP